MFRLHTSRMFDRYVSPPATHDSRCGTSLTCYTSVRQKLRLIVLHNSTGGNGGVRDEIEDSFSMFSEPWKIYSSRIANDLTLIFIKLLETLFVFVILFEILIFLPPVNPAHHRDTLDEKCEQRNIVEAYRWNLPNIWELILKCLVFSGENYFVPFMMRAFSSRWYRVTESFSSARKLFRGNFICFFSFAGALEGGKIVEVFLKRKKGWLAMRDWSDHLESSGRLASEVILVLVKLADLIENSREMHCKFFCGERNADWI